MINREIIERCTRQLKMGLAEAEWVAEHLYNYSCPDFPEMSWEEIDDTFRSVLWFRDKTAEEIERLLCAF